MPPPFRFKTPLPEDTLRLDECVWYEGLSKLGETTLKLLSERKDIVPPTCLAKAPISRLRCATTLFGTSAAMWFASPKAASKVASVCTK